MTEFTAYLLRIAPGFVLGAALLALLPQAQAGARLGVQLGLFVLLRDTMTPLGLWRIGRSPVFWLRLASDPVVLIALALGSLGLLLGCWWLERTLAQKVVWMRGSRALGVSASAGCAALIALPVLALGFGTPVAARGGAVAASLLVPTFVFSLLGNAYEELLFRGFLQGLFTERMSAPKAALLSGLGFGFGHVFLSATVTDIGVPVLAFTVYEGLICAELCRRFGLVPAIIAHGGGIFLIASGLP